jgi:hypothetical protein
MYIKILYKLQNAFQKPVDIFWKYACKLLFPSQKGYSINLSEQKKHLFVWGKCQNDKRHYELLTDSGWIYDRHSSLDFTVAWKLSSETEDVSFKTKNSEAQNKIHSLYSILNGLSKIYTMYLCYIHLYSIHNHYLMRMLKKDTWKRNTSSA